MGVSASEFELRRPGHPRLDMSSAELAVARKDPDQVPAAAQAGEAQLQRDRTTAYQDFWVELPSGKLPEPHPGDSWPYWTGIMGQVRGYLEATARAYALTGDRKYLDPCRQLALAVADWPQWTDPDYGRRPCLDTYSLINGMSCAYDYLYPALSADEREKIRDAIIEKGLVFTYQDGQDEKSYVYQPNAWPNGYAVTNAALGTGALVVLGEVDGAEAWIDQAIEKTQLFFDQQGGRDGGLLEGFGYGSFAIDNLVVFVQRLYDITGVSLLDHPYLGQAIYFPAYFMLPGGGSLPAIADNGGSAGCSPTLTGLARMVMEIRDDPVAAWYLKQAGERDEQIARLAASPRHLPLGRHFRDIDWVALRSGWGQDEALMALKCGQTKSHNHLDQNSFVLGWGPEWLLNDPGYQIYNRPYPAERNLSMEVIRSRHEYTYGTPGHNAILVDGQGQSATPGAISAFFTSAAMTYAAGDAAGPYEKTLGAFVRHVLSIAGGDYIIYDDIITDGADRVVEALFHTTQDGRFVVGGAELAPDDTAPASPVTVRRRHGEARLAALLPESATMTRRTWPDCEEYGHYLSIAGPAQAALNHLFILRPGPLEATPPIEAELLPTESGVALLNRHVDGSDTVILNPGGGEVSAGEVAASAVCAVVTRRGSRIGAGFYDGTSLRLGGTVLLASTRPASVGSSFDGATLRVDLAVPETADISVRSPVGPELVEIEGVESPIELEHDEAENLIHLRGVSGNLRLSARQLPR